MRKTSFLRTLSCRIRLFCFVALGMIYLPAIAQDGATSSPLAKETPAAALPSDPKELMLQAEKFNGLTGSDVKPWHLKATFKLFDEEDKVKDYGIYEEYWVSRTMYKRSYTSSKFNHTDYGTEKDTMHTGDQNPIPWPLALLLAAIVSSWHMNGSVAKCGDDLRAQFTCSNPINYQNRSLPGDIEEGLDGKIVLTAHVESIEPLTTNDETEFKLPPDATPSPLFSGIDYPKPTMINIPAEVAEHLLIKKVEPKYPPLGDAMRVSGTVVLQADIGRKGRIEWLHIISGPTMLQQAALDAVRNWVYEPYLLNNMPVEVRTTINVTFHIPE
jgi:TonB family protein